jgi:hypothetical protein
MKNQYLVAHQKRAGDFPKFIGDCPPPDEKFSEFWKRKLNFR